MFKNILNNNHIGIVGDSGTGKSYATFSLVNNISRRGVPVIIIDTSNSLNDSKMKNIGDNTFSERYKYINIKENKLGISLFSKNNANADKTDSDIAENACQILIRACRLSELQNNEMLESITSLLETEQNLTLLGRLAFIILIFNRRLRYTEFLRRKQATVTFHNESGSVRHHNRMTPSLTFDYFCKSGYLVFRVLVWISRISYERVRFHDFIMSAVNCHAVRYSFWLYLFNHLLSSHLTLKLKKYLKKPKKYRIFIFKNCIEKAPKIRITVRFSVLYC